MKHSAIRRRAPAFDLFATGLCLASTLLVLDAALAAQAAPATGAAGARPCASADSGISLPPGFCATVFADNLGHTRHLVVAPNGVVYVNSWKRRSDESNPARPGGFLIALQDTTGKGRADVIVRFGPDADSGSAGGTGIALYQGAVFAEAGDRIVRYALPAEGIVPVSAPQVVVSGLPLTGDHPMHPFAIDAQGKLYVDLGSATNACQVHNRAAGSAGVQGCAELQTRAGIWRYDARRTDQHFSPAERFATGLRNGEGISFDTQGRIFATQHGRDQLGQNWPQLYTLEQSAEQPAEELVQLESGADYGWPYCYYDLEQRKLVLAPEYGGDGGHAVEQCAGKRPPIAAFPGHWAPNDLAIYNGTLFPDAYRGGAFIAFHGSWNRAPLPQGGYNVVFQPLADGRASGPFVVFADGFAGAIKDPGNALHRPTGLAVGPDGALYISDDQRGRIWRVTYQGPVSAPVEAAPAPDRTPGASAAPSPRPQGGVVSADDSVARLPTPTGATPAQVALGERIFHGQAANGPCASCHGSEAQGTPLAPALSGRTLIGGDGSLQAIRAIIENGVPQPRMPTAAMPPMGGVQLTPGEVSAVAAYVWAISRRGVN